MTPRRLATTITTAILGALLSGCAPAATVRTADVLAPGGFGGGVVIVPAAWHHGVGTLDDNGLKQDVVGNGAQRAPRELSTAELMAFAYGSSMAWQLRLGVAPRVELGVSAGLGQLGGELRVAAMDEDRGHKVSLAPALSVASVNWVGGGPALRLGADLSQRHRRGSSTREFWTPALGTYLSFSPRRLSQNLGKAWGHPITDCKEGWPGTPCATANPHTRARVEVFREELVLSMPASISLQTLSAKGGSELTMGLVPQAVLWARNTRVGACTGCRSGIEAVGYREWWAVSVQVGIGGRSTRGMRLE